MSIPLGCLRVWHQSCLQIFNKYLTSQMSKPQKVIEGRAGSGTTCLIHVLLRAMSGAQTECDNGHTYKWCLRLPSASGNSHQGVPALQLDINDRTYGLQPSGNIWIWRCITWVRSQASIHLPSHFTPMEVNGSFMLLQRSSLCIKWP